eukprot:7252983-Alexandrium_andersonii.AAC.1
MSASLVGSEMCIRDRRPRPRGSSARPCHKPRRAGRPHIFLHGRGPDPVSYTHLTLPTICSV